MKVSYYGHWPLRASNSFPGEQALTCPRCFSQNVSLLTFPGASGTAPGGRWRIGDPGGQEVAKCGDCGERGPHVGIPKAGEVPVGTKLGFSACECVFVVTGRDPEYPSHVVFKQVHHCKTTSCDLAWGQELWLFEDKPIAGVPGVRSFVPWKD